MRGARFRRSNVPNPERETRWPLATVSRIEAIAASTTLATEALAMSVRLATSETSPRLFTTKAVYVRPAGLGVNRVVGRRFRTQGITVSRVCPKNCRCLGLRCFV